MDRPTLKKWYNVGIAAALGFGFALGYTLRNPDVMGVRGAARQVRDFERDFPGCRRIYEQLRGLFAKGDTVRGDYDALLERLGEAISENPGYVPLAALQAAVWEDRLWNLTMGQYPPPEVESLAKGLRLPAAATRDQMAKACRERALQSWLAVETSPLVAEPEKYGERWRILWEQHTNALRQTQVIRTPIDESGMADLARAFNAFALTRDFVRYPNNLSDEPAGYSLEEKHVPDMVHCPQHPEVAFQLPCVLHLSPLRGGTIRRDLEIFRSGMRISGQKLDVEPRRAEGLHLLAFNTTMDSRIVKAQVRIRYTDRPDEEVKEFSVPPWRQPKALLRDPLARRRLDAVHRDSEVHLANGSELNLPSSPFYMYHVAIDLDPKRSVDEIYFPRHDPTTAGLEDDGIDDVCIVALTMI